jgi:hypothetical protein
VIEIEKGIPFLARKRAAEPKYPFEGMEVGASFFVAAKERKAVANKLASATYGHKPKKFSVRQVDGGVRVWRVA